MKNFAWIIWLLFFIVLLPDYRSSSQDMQLSYTIPGENFLDISVPDSQHIWASGIGFVMSSANGGETWKRLDQVTRTEWYGGIFFLNTAFGWVCGSQGTILRTSDGGKSWKISVNEESKFLDIHFISETIGFVCGMNGEIQKTSDGGITWNKIDIHTKSYLNKIVAMGDEIILLVGEGGTIVRSDNSGISWEMLHSPTTLELTNAWISEKEKYWVCGNSGIILQSTDSGSNWYTKPLPYKIDLSALHFFNDKEGIAVGGSTNEDIHQFFTNDSGTTWKEIRNLPRKWWKSLECPNRNNCILAGNDVIMSINTKSFD